MSAMLHPDIETASPSDVRRHQETLWARQWDYVRNASRFYGAKLGSATAGAIDLDRLAELPLTDKEEIRAAQAQHEPFGTHVACAPEKIIRIHRTSGTTGRALVIAATAHDAATTARLGGRGYFASGLRPGDRVVHCLNYCLWTGGVTDHLALEAAGATVIPYGTGGTDGLIAAMRELGVNAISCTPSYPALLEQALRDRFGIEPRALKLRLGLFGGEAGLDNPGFRARLEAAWGFGARNANFGLSEVMSIMGSQCEASNDLHFHGADAVFAELIDAATGTPLPIRDGTTGALVCTNLDKECQPLVRYHARDVVTVTATGRCDCGRSSFRFRVTGRTDDMFVVRGVNVFPTAVQSVVVGMGASLSGHFRIDLDGPGPYDRIVVRAEAGGGTPPADWPAIAAALEQRLKATIGATAEVRLVASESLLRAAGKTRLVERS